MANRLQKYKPETYKNIKANLEKTNADEIRALIGLWLRLGIMGFQHSRLDEIFGLTECSSLDAHLCFSRDRYKMLMRALRFDDPKKRPMINGKWVNKLAHIKKVILLSISYEESRF